MKKLKEKIKTSLGEKRTASLKKALRIGRIVKNVVCWSLIAILTVAIVIFMITKISGGTPTVFGYTLHRIVSGSMEPELKIGDVIVGKKVTDTVDVHVGDIITFQGDSRFDNQKVTHRVMVSPYDNGKGKIVLVTMGDANLVDDGEIDFNDVESKLVMKLNVLRDIYDFFFSQWGLIVFIFLLVLIFFDEIINIVKLSVSRAEQDDTESIQEIVERIKREQLEEKQRLLAEKEGQADDPAPLSEENEDSAVEKDTAQKNDD